MLSAAMCWDFLLQHDKNHQKRPVKSIKRAPKSTKIRPRAARKVRKLIPKTIKGDKKPRTKSKQRKTKAAKRSSGAPQVPQGDEIKLISNPLNPCVLEQRSGKSPKIRVQIKLICEYWKVDLYPCFSSNSWYRSGILLICSSILIWK